MLVLLDIVKYMGFPHLSTAVSYTTQRADSAGAIYADQLGTELNLFWSSVKVITALALTLILLVVAIWILKRFLRVQRIPGISGGALSVLEIRYIAPKKAVVLIKVLERVLIVGVSDNSITTLGELTPEETTHIKQDQKSGSGVFKNILAGFTGKKSAT